MSAPIVISGINTFIVLPILLNVVADIVLLAYTIPKVVHLIAAIPNSGSQWCEPWSYPGQPTPLPDPDCPYWKSVMTILTAISAGFTLLLWYVPFYTNSAHHLRIFWRASHRQSNTNQLFISIIFAVQLLLRGVAIYRTKLWKIRLSSILPREIDIHFRMRVLRQEEESAEGSASGRGPVYLS